MTMIWSYYIFWSTLLEHVSCMFSIHFSSQAGERPDPETRTLTRALLYFMTILILWLPGASMRALRFFPAHYVLFDELMLFRVCTACFSEHLLAWHYWSAQHAERLCWKVMDALRELTEPLGAPQIYVRAQTCDFSHAFCRFLHVCGIRWFSVVRQRLLCL